MEWLKWILDSPWLVLVGVVFFGSFGLLFFMGANKIEEENEKDRLSKFNNLIGSS